MLKASSFGSAVSHGRCLVLPTASAAALFGTTAVASAFPPGPSSLTVNSTTDAAYNASTDSCAGGSATCTLRAAVQVADSNGGANTITLPAGDYMLTLADTANGQTDNPEVGDLDVNSGVVLTLTGAGASSTTIDATHIDRAFAVHSTGSLSISGVTVEHGAQPNTAPSDHSIAGDSGGAFYNDGELSISNSALIDNSAYYGGAIYSDTTATSTSITNSTVTGNSANDEGGFAYIASGSLTLTGDTVTHNQADSDGGAIYDDESGNTAGPLTITSSTVSSNEADSDGGAIYLSDAGLLTVTNSTMDGNANDDSEGGAIYTSTGDIAVSGSTFAGNAGDEGGAIYLEGSSSTAVESVTTSTFSGNIATSSEGGAITDDEGNLSVTRSTFTGNDASSNGGALYYESDDGLALTNDTFDGNQADEGGAVDLDDAAVTAGTIALLNDTITDNTGYSGGGIYDPQYLNTIENTIVAENGGGQSTNGGGDCYGNAATDNAGSADIGGNIDSDGTCFSTSVTGDQVDVNPDLGVLSNNGGALETDALLAGSPAIGGAIQSACPSIDELGVTRPAACDSGAYQTSTAALSITNSSSSTSTVGSPLTYTLTATNNGPGAATGVVVADLLPANEQYVGSTSSQGSCSATQGQPGSRTLITCSLGTINSTGTGTSDTASITITVIPTAVGALTDSASVDATSAGATSGIATPVATAVSAAAGTTTGSSTTPTNTTTTTTTTTAGSGTPTTTSGSGNTGSVTTKTTYIKPVTATGVASKIRESRAYLHALVNPAGLATTYTIQVRRNGTSRWIGMKVRNLAAGTAVDEVAVTIVHLKAGSKYAFRSRATSLLGTSYGQVSTFRTAKAKKAHKQ